MDDGVEFFPMKNFVHRPGITQVGLANRNLVRDRCNVGTFDLRIIEIVEVIQDRDLMACSE